MASEEVIRSPQNLILDLLSKRRSRYAFSPREVELDKLRSLFEAARWAPSSFNEQPWSFILATKDKPEEHSRLVNVLVEGNRLWAKNAPVLILSLARLRFSRTGGTNRHATYDLGQAVANLTVQATALGLVVHQMAGFDVNQARELLHVPEGHAPMSVIAVGYPGDSNGLPEELGQREAAPRIRRPREEFVFSGSWGAPFFAMSDQEGERRVQ